MCPCVESLAHKCLEVEVILNSRWKVTGAKYGRLPNYNAGNLSRGTLFWLIASCKQELAQFYRCNEEKKTGDIHVRFANFLFDLNQWFGAVPRRQICALLHATLTLIRFITLHRLLHVSCWSGTLALLTFRFPVCNIYRSIFGVLLF